VPHNAQSDRIHPITCTIHYEVQQHSLDLHPELMTYIHQIVLSRLVVLFIMMTRYNRRRKDKAHDVGDSSPGTYGDSQGTFHDRMGGGPTFDPDAENTLSETESNKFTGSNESNQRTREKNRSHQQKESKKSDRKGFNGKSKQATKKDSKRMEYAKRYGDSWPVKRQKRFLQEHELSASDMGWSLKE